MYSNSHANFSGIRIEISLLLGWSDWVPFTYGKQSAAVGCLVLRANKAEKNQCANAVLTRSAATLLDCLSTSADIWLPFSRRSSSVHQPPSSEVCLLVSWSIGSLGTPVNVKNRLYWPTSHVLSLQSTFSGPKDSPVCHSAADSATVLSAPVLPVQFLTSVNSKALL